MILAPLAWVGARSQWALALGVIAALVVPGPGALLEGTLAFWVTLLYALAMTRIDLAAVARRAIGPRRLARNLGLCAVLMLGAPVLAWFVATFLGLPEAHVEALVYTFAAPPLGSAAAFCLMVGFDAAFAIELTVLGSLVAPISMPVISRAVLGEAIPIDPLEMGERLAMLIGLGSVGAIVARQILGAARIERHRASFDGLAVVVLVIFLFPLFEGLTEVIASIPAFAAATMALVILANLGVQIATFPVAKRLAGLETGGAGALVTGNRNAALALASLPGDPLFTLWVALYQFPMYFTPLVMRRVARR